MDKALARGVLAGMAGLAVAMGIGRFAFTPILPMMQAEGTVDLVRGGWLASANYVGYLAGGVSALVLRWSPRFAIRAGLALVALSTLGMAFTHAVITWLALRAVAGIASAWVLVFASAWMMQRVGAGDARARARAGGVLYAGVGVGIVIAGLACFALGVMEMHSTMAWAALGAIACVVTVVTWNAFAESPGAAAAATAAPMRGGAALLIVACYAAFGYGYIVPATFLSAMARDAAAGSAWYGLAWPLFGAAAAASTLAAAPLQAGWGDRRLWAGGQVVMALGVALPLLSRSPGSVALSGLLVGATFMVVTMAGLQEARRVGGRSARALMAAMTSSFAIGQIAGPLVVSATAARGSGYGIALGSAALLLLATGTILFFSARKANHEGTHAGARASPDG